MEAFLCNSSLSCDLWCQWSSSLNLMRHQVRLCSIFLETSVICWRRLTVCIASALFCGPHIRACSLSRWTLLRIPLTNASWRSLDDKAIDVWIPTASQPMRAQSGYGCIKPIRPQQRRTTTDGTHSTTCLRQCNTDRLPRRENLVRQKSRPREEEEFRLVKESATDMNTSDNPWLLGNV